MKSVFKPCPKLCVMAGLLTILLNGIASAQYTPQQRDIPVYVIGDKTQTVALRLFEYRYPDTASEHLYEKLKTSVRASVGSLEKIVLDFLIAAKNQDDAAMKSFYGGPHRDKIDPIFLIGFKHVMKDCVAIRFRTLWFYREFILVGLELVGHDSRITSGAFGLTHQGGKYYRIDETMDMGVLPFGFFTSVFNSRRAMVVNRADPAYYSTRNYSSQLIFEHDTYPATLLFDDEKLPVEKPASWRELEKMGGVVGALAGAKIAMEFGSKRDMFATMDEDTKEFFKRNPGMKPAQISGTSDEKVLIRRIISGGGHAFVYFTLVDEPNAPVSLSIMRRAGQIYGEVGTLKYELHRLLASPLLKEKLAGDFM